jgi:segregation and condensation protein B
VIAYRQPVTGPEIQEIRGVNVSGVIKTLLEKRLLVTAGRKAVLGRPIMYRTSKDFLMRFGLSDLEELPSLKEFEQLARAALGADEGIAPIDPEGGTEEVAATGDNGTEAAVAQTAPEEAAPEPVAEAQTHPAEPDTEPAEHTRAESAS